MSETLHGRKATGLAALGNAIGVAKRSSHSFVMLRMSDAEELHQLVGPINNREKRKIYMRITRARKRAKKAAIK